MFILLGVEKMIIIFIVQSIPTIMQFLQPVFVFDLNTNAMDSITVRYRSGKANRSCENQYSLSEVTSRTHLAVIHYERFTSAQCINIVIRGSLQTSNEVVTVNRLRNGFSFNSRFRSNVTDKFSELLIFNTFTYLKNFTNFIIRKIFEDANCFFHQLLICSFNFSRLHTIRIMRGHNFLHTIRLIICIQERLQRQRSTDDQCKVIRNASHVVDYFCHSTVHDSRIYIVTPQRFNQLGVDVIAVSLVGKVFKVIDETFIHDSRNFDFTHRAP